VSGRLRGKVALVTGAGQGIGRATACAFVAEGATVWATDRDKAALAGIDGARLAVLDVLDPEAVARVLDAAGGFDILFNCAGYVAAGTILDCAEEDWARSFELNVTAVYRLIRRALPAMIARGGGSIVNVASVAGSITGVPDRFAYGASKAALIGLTKSVAADFVGAGVRCNAICPGTVDTPSLHGRLHDTEDYDAAWKAFVARQPMGRVGRPEEVASLAVHLAGDESRFTTGQTQVIDGGWTM